MKELFSRFSTANLFLIDVYRNRDDNFNICSQPRCLCVTSYEGVSDFFLPSPTQIFTLFSNVHGLVLSHHFQIFGCFQLKLTAVS